jgi:cation:H+ antiporter
MLTAWIQIISGLALLIYGADRFVTGAAQSARLLGVSPLIIGLTIVGMATSAPEVLVGSVAALDGKTGIAVGNAIGSNIANISLVLGGAVLFRPFLIDSKTLMREYLIMMAIFLLGYVILSDYSLDRLDAIILLLALAGFLAWTVYQARNPKHKDPYLEEISEHVAEREIRPWVSVLLLVGGLLILIAGAEVLVRGAVTFAQSMGISDLVIGLTIIAVGTSLPELAASIVSIIKNEADMAIGNIIGSNIFNMLDVLGIPVLIHPDGFAKEVITRDFVIMISLSLLLGWIIFTHKKFHRIYGFILLACFLGYQSWLFNASGS